MGAGERKRTKLKMMTEMEVASEGDKMLSIGFDISWCLDIELSPDYYCGVMACSSG